MNASLPNQQLFEKVTERLASIGTETDHLLLTRWKVIDLCQLLLGTHDELLKEEVTDALVIFCKEGPGPLADQAFGRVDRKTSRTNGNSDGSVLPQFAPEMRQDLLARLREYEKQGVFAVEQAIKQLPSLRKRMRNTPAGALSSGICHRLELVAEIAQDVSRNENDRCRAAAAILYLDELRDIIPDSFEYIGLIDDDFALRTVLEEVGGFCKDDRLHWAERISELWNDLPFLRGVQLVNENGPVATTWLDRINSYVSYLHAFNGDAKPLVLMQPSIACSPLHSVVSLIGLLILDGITSSESLLQSLQVGQTYEVDGKYYARYKGITGDPHPGLLRLEFRDGFISIAPTIADRMVAVPEHSLSKSKKFSVHVHDSDAEPIQKFFKWTEAIGAASISSRVLFVTSQQRATKLFSGIKSNGVSLIKHGMIKFSGLHPNPDTVRGGLVIVVPNLSAARSLINQGVAVHSIIVDGYERLYRGRHDLPFLLRMSSSPPLIVWSPEGYYPNDSPSWLPEHRRLQLQPGDISYILDLDGDIDDSMAPSRASLWEAATGLTVTKEMVLSSEEEQAVLNSISDFLQKAGSSTELPEYWRYHLNSCANILRILVSATPASWSDIHIFANTWKNTFDEQWKLLRPRAANAFLPVANAQKEIFECLGKVPYNYNSKAGALLEFLENDNGQDWKLICDKAEQIKAFGRFARKAGIDNCTPILLRDLDVCHKCLVVGWRNKVFSNRIWAHTPRRLVALVDEKEAKKWDRAKSRAQSFSGESLLEAVGHKPKVDEKLPEPRNTYSREPQNIPLEKVNDLDAEQSRISCTFLWLADESECKVLARSSRVLMEVGEQAKERKSHSIRPGDNVILGPGSSRWSPADEFTGSVIEAIEESHPELIRDVKEWRRALEALRSDQEWTTEELREKLKEVGVSRETITLDGWLCLDRAAPIGPQKIRKELRAIWELVANTYSQKTAEDVANACSKLRSLRAIAGRSLLSLWKGRTVNLGVDKDLLENLIQQLRQEVQVYEVDAVTYGTVPEAMLGWWVNSDIAAMFEDGGDGIPLDIEQVAIEDDGEDGEEDGEDD